MTDEARREDGRFPWGRFFTGLVACLLLVAGALVVGRAVRKNPGTANGMKAVAKDVAEAISPTEPAPTSRLVIWDDTPDKCLNQTCKGKQFSGQQLTDGKYLWTCTTCKGMWYFPYKARFVVGITDHHISFGALPQALALVPKPKEETLEPKPEPKRR